MKQLEQKSAGDASITSTILGEDDLMDMQPNLTENIQYDIPVRSQTPSQAIPTNTRPVILTPKEKSITRIIVKKSSAL